MEEQKIIIGREGNQPFPITQDGVSGRHASLTIRTDGTWVLEDLNSMNGTYIRNKDFVFERVGRKVIEKDTVLLDINQYDYFKELEQEYNFLKSKLDSCIIKLDENGDNVVKGPFTPVAKTKKETKKVQIIISDLVNALDLNNYEIEVKTTRD